MGVCSPAESSREEIPFLMLLPSFSNLKLVGGELLSRRCFSAKRGNLCFRVDGKEGETRAEFGRKLLLGFRMQMALCVHLISLDSPISEVLGRSGRYP